MLSPAKNYIIMIAHKQPEGLESFYMSMMNTRVPFVGQGMIAMGESIGNFYFRC